MRYVERRCEHESADDKKKWFVHWKRQKFQLSASNFQCSHAPLLSASVACAVSFQLSLDLRWHGCEAPVFLSSYRRGSVRFALWVLPFLRRMYTCVVCFHYKRKLFVPFSALGFHFRGMSATSDACPRFRPACQSVCECILVNAQVRSRRGDEVEVCSHLHCVHRMRKIWCGGCSWLIRTNGTRRNKR